MCQNIFYSHFIVNVIYTDITFIKLLFLFLWGGELKSCIRYNYIIPYHCVHLLNIYKTHHFMVLKFPYI